MTAREEVKDYQRRVAELDRAHQNAVRRLARAKERRAAIVAEQDALIAEGEGAVEKAVVAMGLVAGPEATGALLGRSAAEVRRLVRQRS